MSPNTNIAWDPNRLRLDQNEVKRVQGAVGRGRRVTPVTGRFIAGPIDAAWMIQAAQLGVKTVLVGLFLWYLAGLRRSATFIVSNLVCQEWRISPDAKRRALRKLQKAGLIVVEGRGKRSPRVTLLAPPTPRSAKVDDTDR